VGDCDFVCGIFGNGPVARCDRVFETACIIAVVGQETREL
jgi:hypothetical protein